MAWLLGAGLALGAVLDFTFDHLLTRGAATILALAMAVLVARDFIRRARPEGWVFVRRRWVDSVLTLLFLLLVEERIRSLLLAGPTGEGVFRGHVEAYYVVGALKCLSRTTFFFEWRHALRLRPAQSAVVGFALAIALGAILLTLPAVSRGGVGVSLLNALFMSTSAVCVTGLVVVDPISTFNPAGQLLLLALIQIGGLGITTLGVLLPFLAARRVQLKDELAIKDSLGLEAAGSLRRLLWTVLLVTFATEAIGAAFLYPVFREEASPLSAAFRALFHSVSAFNNAGFALYPDSLVRYAGDPVVNLTIPALVIMGGLGFPVWMELGRRLKWGGRRSPDWRPPTLHLRLVLATSGALVAASAILFLVLEWGHSMSGLSFLDKLWASWFQAVTPRTAGFNTVDFTRLGDATVLLFILLMFVGGSPGGTAGGVKTTTAAVMILTLRAAMRQRSDVSAFGRSVPPEMIRRSLALVFTSAAVILTLAGLLLLTESAPFRDVLFETVSAFGTVGLSLGLTPSLTAAGKLIVTLGMFIGRLGPLTVAFALAQGARKGKVEYPEGRVIIG